MSISAICKKIRKIGAAAIVLILATACAKHQVPVQGIGYNKGVGSFYDKQVLLNIVRAAKNQPMYFSTIGSTNFKDAVNGELDISIPLVNFDPRVGTITPKAKFNSGMNNYSVEPLLHKDFLKELHKRASLNRIAFYLEAGFPRELIYTLLIKRIRLTKKQLDTIKTGTYAHCTASNLNRYREALCKEIARDLDYFNADGEGSSNCLPRRPRGADLVTTYTNHGRNRCRYSGFQAIIRMLLINNVELQQVGPVENEAFRLSLYGIDGQIILELASTDKIDSKTASPSSSIATRSTQGLLYYLGSLARGQLSGNVRNVPSIVSGGGKLAAIFTVNRGKSGNPISVWFQGTQFSVPLTTGNSRSGLAFTIAKQAVEFAIGKDDIPSTNQNVLVSVTN